MIFFPGRRQALTEKLKGNGTSIVHGTMRWDGSFSKMLFIQTSKENRAALLYSICHRENCNSCSCLTTLLLTSIRWAVICVLLSAGTIHMGQIGRTGGHDVLPVPHLWEGHLNHKVNDNFFYTCNRNNDPWHLVVKLPVTASGLCNALNWNDALSPFVWLDLRKGCARFLRINEQKTQTNMHLQSQALCYFSFAALEKPTEMSLSGFKMWMLFWYSTARRTAHCKYITPDDSEKLCEWNLLPDIRLDCQLVTLSFHLQSTRSRSVSLAMKWDSLLFFANRGKTSSTYNLIFTQKNSCVCYGLKLIDSLSLSLSLDLPAACCHRITEQI